MPQDSYITSPKRAKELRQAAKQVAELAEQDDDARSGRRRRSRGPPAKVAASSSPGAAGMAC